MREPARTICNGLFVSARHQELTGERPPGATADAKCTGRGKSPAACLFRNTEGQKDFFAPTVGLSPIAGALVDRWNRKLVMMLSDLAAGLSAVAILLLYVGGYLQIWHLYIAGAFTGAFQAFQWPAYSAAISTMLPAVPTVREVEARLPDHAGPAEAKA